MIKDVRILRGNMVLVTAALENPLTFTILWASSADNKLMIFLLFFQKIDFDTPCKLSPLEINNHYQNQQTKKW